MFKGSCKKIFAGMMIASLIGSIFPVTPIVQAEDLPSYYERTPSEREKALLSARDFAYKYLRNSSEEPLWKNKFPYISGEKFFYTANDDIPSYVEFKVSTSENPDSGFIIVNLDGNDVEVPIASPSGKTPSEALNIRFNKNHKNSENKKLYYFSPFDQWIVDENGNAETLNPNNQEDEIIETEKSENNFENNSEISLRSAENKNNEEKILTEEGKNKQNAKFAEMKKDAMEFVNSSETRSMRVTTRNSYIFPGVSADKLLPGYRGYDCAGSLPCYDQHRRKFGSWWLAGDICQSGCVPVAMAIVMGYHARNNYPNLLNGRNTPLTQDSLITNMIERLGNEMGTFCGGENKVEGITNSGNFSKALKIFNEKGYKFRLESKERVSPYQISLRAKQAIDAGRPLLGGIDFKATDPNQEGPTSHMIVIFGYSTQYWNILRVNLGYGKDDTNNGYYGSNLNFNIMSVKYAVHRDDKGNIVDYEGRINSYYDFIP